jgi:HlyD family secretion protein
MNTKTEKPIFRQAVMERASSPERFDEVLKVTRPRGWVALAAVGILLAVVVVWGLVGRISNRVEGRGILVRTGGVLDVVAPATGPVLEVSVEPGDSVTQQQVVVRLGQPELEDQIRAARSRLAAARDRYAQIQSFTTRGTGLEAARVARERADLEASVRAAEQSLRWVRERLQAQQQLLDKGLITEMAIQTTRQQHDDLERQIREGRSRVAQLSLQRLEVDNSTQEAVRTGRTEVTQAELEVARLERELATKSRVVTPFTGRVLEVMAEQGRVVERGEAVLRLDRGDASKGLVAAVYVPSQYGKRVQPGMRIHLAPSTVRQEEFGMLVGEVVFVSDYPATSEAMLKTLKNQQLVQELSGEGAPYQIYARLVPDTSTESRYRWSSSKGPPMGIESGTLVEALVTVQEQRPAELVLPALRKWSGVQGGR